MDKSWSIEKMISIASQYNSVLDVGCGSGSVIKRVRAKNRCGIDVCEQALRQARRSNNGVSFVSGNLQELPKLFKNVDEINCVIGVDIIEHFTKAEALQFIKDCEEIASHHLLFFIPVGNHPQTKDDRGFNNDYYQTHRSTWYPQDMEELGYETYYYPNWHKNIASGKEKGAMFCQKIQA